MAFTKFGPGTLSFTISGGTAVDFALGTKAVTIAHEYEESGESVTYLDGSSDAPGVVRGDSLTADFDANLSDIGFYNFLFVNDLATAMVTYVPNTVDAASWSGNVQLRLPDDVSAEGFGSKLAASVTLPFIGAVAFTPIATQTPPLFQR